MSYGGVTSVLPSAARTTTANTAAFALQSNAALQGKRLNLALNITAVSGTSPSMTVSLQWSFDNVNWFTPSPADAFAAQTAAATVLQQFAAKAPFVRVNYAITGTTPSFTFQLDLYMSDE